MSRTRAYRRQQRDKAIARATRRAKELVFRYNDDPADYFYWVRRSAVTPHPCSRHCCGNPRHHFDGRERITMSERKFLEAWNLSTLHDSESLLNNIASPDHDGSWW